VARDTPHRVGIYLGVVQLLFALTWTVYVLYLPALAARAGIDKSAVPYILLLDQVVFAATDLAMGALADRLVRGYRRLALVVLGVTPRPGWRGAPAASWSSWPGARSARSRRGSRPAPAASGPRSAPSSWPAPPGPACSWARSRPRWPTDARGARAA